MPVPFNQVKHPGIIVGQVGERQMLEGWHEREREGRSGIPYRATTDAASLVLKRLSGSKRLYALISGPVPLYGGKMSGRIIVNRRKYELPLSVDVFVLRSYPVETNSDILEIALQIDQAVVPDHVVGNGDARPLGWFLSAIWQE